MALIKGDVGLPGGLEDRQIIKYSFGYKTAPNFDRFEAKQKCLLVKPVGALVIFAPRIAADRWDGRRDGVGVALKSLSTHPKDLGAGLVSNA